MTTTSLRTTLPAALLATLVLTGCGGADTGTDSGTDAAPAPAAPTQAEVEAAEAGSAGAEDPLETVLDGGTIDASLDTLGIALSSALPGATDYEVDGTTLTVDFDGDGAGGSGCTIVGAVQGSVDLPPDSTIVLSYDDGDQTC